MTDDILADIYRHNTAIHVSDMFDDPDFNNPVTVGFCPLVLREKPKTSDELNIPLVTQAPAYFEKVSTDLREFITEYREKLGDKAESVYNATLAYISDNYNAIMDKAHSIGIVVELSGSFGMGVVTGAIFAVDKYGSSRFGFAGLTAGATVGWAVALGVMYYPNLRRGLQGWGGNFNASIAAGLVGAQWEAVMTGGEAGHFAQFAVGVEVALSVEFAKTWLISDKDY